VLKRRVVVLFLMLFSQELFFMIDLKIN